MGFSDVSEQLSSDQFVWHLRTCIPVIRLVSLSMMIEHSHTFNIIMTASSFCSFVPLKHWNVQTVRCPRSKLGIFVALHLFSTGRLTSFMIGSWSSRYSLVFVSFWNSTTVSLLLRTAPHLAILSKSLYRFLSSWQFSKQGELLLWITAGMQQISTFTSLS